MVYFRFKDGHRQFGNKRDLFQDRFFTIKNIKIILLYLTQAKFYSSCQIEVTCDLNDKGSECKKIYNLQSSRELSEWRKRALIIELR